MCTGFSRPKRRAAIIASQQHPQQLQMNATSRCTFSPNWTSLLACASASRSMPSAASTRRAYPWRISESAVPPNVMQMFMGALQARPTCSALWRQ